MTEGPPPSPSASLAAFSAATRVAGAVVAAGYLSGIVTGPLVAVVGGLALITFGHALVSSRAEGALGTVALAVSAGALGVVSLRWGSLSLEEIRGAQAVLGPTVLVGPDRAAAAAWAAGGGAVAALAVWIGRRPRGWESGAWAAELVLASIAVASAFWGPALSGGPRLASEAATTAAASAAVGVTAFAGSSLLARVAFRWRIVVAVAAGLATVAGAALVASVL